MAPPLKTDHYPRTEYCSRPRCCATADAATGWHPRRPTWLVLRPELTTPSPPWRNRRAICASCRAVKVSCARTTVSAKVTRDGRGSSAKKKKQYRYPGRAIIKTQCEPVFGISRLIANHNDNIAVKSPWNSLRLVLYYIVLYTHRTHKTLVVCKQFRFYFFISLSNIEPPVSTVQRSSD